MDLKIYSWRSDIQIFTITAAPAEGNILKMKFRINFEDASEWVYLF